MSSINSTYLSWSALRSPKAVERVAPRSPGEQALGTPDQDASRSNAYWTIPVPPATDTSSLGAARDSIAQTKVALESQGVVLDKALIHLDQIRNGLSAAKRPEADLSAIQKKLDTAIDELKKATKPASPEDYALSEDLIGEVVGLSGSSGAIDRARNSEGTKVRIANGLSNVDEAIGNVKTLSEMVRASRSMIETQELMIGMLGPSLTPGSGGVSGLAFDEITPRSRSLS